MNWVDLQQEKVKLEERLQAIAAEIDKRAATEFEGCWIDSTTGRKGKGSYTRLRWFNESGRKGCRTLKEDEIARAKESLHWLSERAIAAKELDLVCMQIAELKALAKQHGLALPEVEQPTIATDASGYQVGDILRIGAEAYTVRSVGNKHLILTDSKGDRCHLVNGQVRYPK